MTVLKSFMAFNDVGKYISMCLNSGDTLDAMLVNYAFKKFSLDLNSREVLSYTNYLRGLLTDTASSNMEYFQILGYSVRFIDISHMSVVDFSVAIRNKANNDNMPENYLSPRFGLGLTDSVRMAHFTYGFIGK